MEKKIVYYKDFGAVGDGVHEDLDAIRACHEYANEHGCKVMADPGATYYVAETGGRPAVIQTDVDWGDATFIVDDKVIPPESPSRSSGIFLIKRTHPVKVYDEESGIVKAINEKGGIIADEFTHAGYAPGFKCMLIIHDVKHGAYNRLGCHSAGNPNPQRELVIVDECGNVDPETKLLLNYNYVTSIGEYRIDDEPLTVEGGKFITIANCAPPFYTYYSRGIKVQRSNVTLKGVVHDVTEEGAHGAPAGSFFAHHIANNVLYEDLRVQSHKSYRDYVYDENGKVIRVNSIMGSYDIGGAFGNYITYYKCIQTNFWKWEDKMITYNERERWGVMGSNYNKNITFDSSVLSRFDAHAGIYNVVIKNTTISYIKLTGGGKAIIENSKIISPEDVSIPLFELRWDYGCTWKGDIIIRNCEFINWAAPEVFICSAGWANWNFGYNTTFPNITIDGLKIDKPTDKICVFRFGVEKQNYDCPFDMPTLQDGSENKNPMVICKNVQIKNNENGYSFVSANHPYIADRIEIITE